MLVVRPHSLYTTSQRTFSCWRTKAPREVTAWWRDFVSTRSIVAIFFHYALAIICILDPEVDTGRFKGFIN